RLQAVSHLYERLAGEVDKWRVNGYPSEFPVVGETLEWAGEMEEGALRFLRVPQLRALETYWYLRLVEGTPHVRDLYERPFKRKSELRDALGVSREAFETVDYEMDALWERVVTDDGFVKQFRLEALRETLTLDYSSYILSLAMGAGKTILIAAIIATE